jgi:hypothetical protein
VSGLSIGKGCTSTFGNIAVGIGFGATADAKGGLFGMAFAVGADAQADAADPKGIFGTAIAVGKDAVSFVASGSLDSSVALGVAASSEAAGNLNAAVALGNGAESTAEGDANASFAAGHEAEATAEGAGNFATAAGNPGTNVITGPNTPTKAIAIGVFNRAAADGNGNDAEAWSPLHGIGNNTALVVGSGSTATINGPIGTKTNQVAVALGKNKIVQK